MRKKQTSKSFPREQRAAIRSSYARAALEPTVRGVRTETDRHGREWTVTSLSRAGRRQMLPNYTREARRGRAQARNRKKRRAT